MDRTCTCCVPVFYHHQVLYVGSLLLWYDKSITCIGCYIPMKETTDFESGVPYMHTRRGTDDVDEGGKEGGREAWRGVAWRGVCIFALGVALWGRKLGSGADTRLGRGLVSSNYPRIRAYTPRERRSLLAGCLVDWQNRGGPWIYQHLEEV